MNPRLQTSQAAPFVTDLRTDRFNLVLDICLDVEFFANLGKAFLLGFIHGMDTFL